MYKEEEKKKKPLDRKTSLTRVKTAVQDPALRDLTEDGHTPGAQMYRMTRDKNSPGKQLSCNDGNSTGTILFTC